MIKDRDLWNLTSPNKDLVDDSFTKIYEEYKLLVYYVSFEITQNKSDSEDILNETFLKFYENRFTIKKAKGIKYFLVTTSKNLSINLVKRNSKTDLIEDDEVFSESDDNSFLDDYLKEFAKILNQEELDLIVYHLIYDFSFKEIGEMKNETVNAISGKYRRALAKLKEKYKRK